jgi:hypothetical protein
MIESIHLRISNLKDHYAQKCIFSVRESADIRQIFTKKDKILRFLSYDNIKFTVRMSGGNGFAGTEAGPFIFFFAKTEAAHHVPLHLDVVRPFADIHIDAGFLWLETGVFSQVRLLVLAFDGVIGETPIDILAVDANTHRSNSPKERLSSGCDMKICDAKLDVKLKEIRVKQNTLTPFLIL